MIRQMKDVNGRTVCRSVTALAGTVALVGFAMVAEAAIVKTTGKAKADTTRTENGLAAATGSACVDVSSGAVANPAVGAVGACAAPGTIAGLGKTKAKFVANAMGVLQPQFDSFSNSASATGFTGATTLASGSAQWNSFITLLAGGVTKFGAAHQAQASVGNDSYTGITGPNGSADAEATDPMVFVHDSPGVLQYELTFGSASGEPFAFLCDSPAGYGSIEFRASFSNVSNTNPDLPMSLDGELIAVVIEASGIVETPDDLSIVVDAWPGLELTSGDLQMAAEFLRASMEVLGDGSVGFAGEIPFVGPGGAFPTIALAYEPGEVYYEDHLLTTAEMVLSDPEPVSIVFSNAPDGHIDPLDTGTGSALTAGIGGAGTANQGPVQYSTIAVMFDGEPSPAPTPAHVSVSCTGGICPTVTGVSGLGAGPYQVSLSGVIPPLRCTTLSFNGPAFAPGTRLQYRSHPGNVTLDFTTNTQDLLQLIFALNNGAANLPASLPRYNINRSTGAGTQVNTQDLLRLIGLLNGTNTTQAFNGSTVATCP